MGSLKKHRFLRKRSLNSSMSSLMRGRKDTLLFRREKVILSSRSEGSPTTYTQKISNKSRIDWIYRERPGNEMNYNIRVGTRSILTPLRAGSKNELPDTLALYKIYITGLQKLRWKDRENTGLKKRRTDIYSYSYICAEKPISMVL